jgi:hypothetical protein
VLNLSLAAGYRMRGELQALCDKAYYRGQTVIAARRNIPVGGDGLPAEFSACEPRQPFDNLPLGCRGARRHPVDAALQRRHLGEPARLFKRSRNAGGSSSVRRRLR